MSNKQKKNKYGSGWLVLTWKLCWHSCCCQFSFFSIFFFGSTNSVYYIDPIIIRVAIDFLARKTSISSWFLIYQEFGCFLFVFFLRLIVVQRYDYFQNYFLSKFLICQLLNKKKSLLFVNWSVYMNTLIWLIETLSNLKTRIYSHFG